MTIYDFLEARRVIMSNVRTDSNSNLISILVNVSCEFLQIMTRYDFEYRLEEWILEMFEPTTIWSDFTFG